LVAATDLAAEVLVHGLVAATAVQLVIRRLPVTQPSLRLHYRLLALALPLAAAPLLLALAPFRRDDWFTDLALFSSSRWQRIDVLGIGLRDAGLVLFAALGLLLLLPDVLRLFVHWRRDLGAVRHHVAADDPVAVRLRDEVAAIAADMGVSPPRLLVFDTPAAVLHCRGAWRPTVVAARGIVDRLEPDQLRAAIAHELAHVRRGDVLHSWTLLALRAAQWFNPVAQIIGRRAVQEMEWEADRVAATVTERPLAIARALVTSVRGRDTEFLGLLGRSRISAVEERCHRLVSLHRDPPDVPGPHAWREPIIAAMGLAVLLFFVI
jgi:Zn-dependent protease with chaperone function